MQYDNSYPGEARITFSSILLLVIFVSAFALITAAIVWRPWFDDDKAAVISPPASEQTIDDNPVVPVTDEVVVPDTSGDQVGATQ